MVRRRASKGTAVIASNELIARLRRTCKICTGSPQNLARIGINFGCHFYLPSNGISVDNTEELANDVSDLDQRAARLAFADHVADPLNNFAGPAAVSHDVGEQLRQLLGSDFTRCD